MNKEMTLNEYQYKAMETAVYPLPCIYTALGLAGEAGEVANKVKKVLRDANSDFSDEARKKAIADEIGDVMWYCATLAHDLGFSLEEIAENNYSKLASRKLKGTLHGDGDNR